MENSDHTEGHGASIVIMAAGIFTTVIGLLALLGWILDLPLLASFGARLIPMAPSTALCFVLLGLALFFRPRFPQNRATVFIGLFIGLFVGVTGLLLSYFSFTGIHPDIEHLGFSVTSSLNGTPIGHMSAVTAMCFVAGALSFLLTLFASAAKTKQAWAGLLLAFLVFLTSSILLLEYLLKAPLMYTGGVIPPSLPGSLAFLFLSSGLMISAGLRLWSHERIKDAVTAPVSYILFLIFIFLASGILAGGYSIYYNYEQNFRVTAENQLSSIANLKMDQLVQYRNERLADASVLFKNPSFSNLVRRFFDKTRSGNAQRQLQTWLAKYPSYNQYDRALLFDKRDVLRMSAPEALEVTSTTIQEDVIEVLHSGEIAFQDFYRDEHSQRIYLALLIPVIDNTEGSRPFGVVVLRIDPSLYLTRLIQTWPVESRTSETLLARREGNDAIFLNELRFQKNTALNLRFPLNNDKIAAVRAVLGQKGIIEATDYRGIPIIADIRRVPDSPWFLVTRQDISEVYEPVRGPLWLVISLIGSLIAAAGAGTGMVWRHQRGRFYREQYASAEALRNSESRYRSLFENMVEGYAYCKMLFNNDAPEDFIYIDVNSAFENITGLNNVEGKKVSEVIPDIQKSNPELLEIYGRVALGGHPETFETCVESLGIWFSIAVYCPGKEYFVAVFNDITERKRAEEKIWKLNAELEIRVIERTAQMEATNKELDAFAYSVSHDLRAPLRSIDGFSQVLLEDHARKLDEKGKDSLQRVRAATQRMGQLIDDLLDLSRISRSELRRDSVDLSTIAHEVAGQIQKDDSGRDVEFVIHPELQATGDAHLLQIVLENLMRNAFKFTSKHAKARIEFGMTGRNGTRVYFVRDDGAGFDMKYADKMFGAFQRMHSLVEFPGIGIGLATVRRIINRHGGSVWAESEVEKGATFYFTLK